MPYARLPRVVFSVAMAALLTSLAVPARAATTTYTSVYTGGTIAPDDTVLLDNGASVTGNVTSNGTLQFNQSGTTLTISNTISGTGTLNVDGGLVSNTTSILGNAASGVGTAKKAIHFGSR